MIEKFGLKEVYPTLLNWTMILDPNSLCTQLSQLALVQIIKFQCLTSPEFPEFFKTHPTFICRSIFKASMGLQTKPAMFFVRPCIYLMDTDLDLL